MTSLNAIPASEHTDDGANIMDLLGQTFSFEPVHSQRQSLEQKIYIATSWNFPIAAKLNETL